MSIISSVTGIQVTFTFPSLGDAAAALAKLADARVAVEVKEVNAPKPEAKATPSADKPSAPAVDKPSSAAKKEPAASAPAEKSKDEPAPDLSMEVAKAITERIITPEGKAKVAAVLSEFRGEDNVPCRAGKHLKASDRAAFLDKLKAAFETSDDMT